MEHFQSTFSKTQGYGARILLLEHAVVPLHIFENLQTFENVEQKEGEWYTGYIMGMFGLLGKHFLNWVCILWREIFRVGGAEVGAETR